MRAHRLLTPLLLLGAGSTVHAATAERAPFGTMPDGTPVEAVTLGDALCLEPQMFPDAPNQPALGSARLDPGRHYTNTFAFHFSTRPAQ